MNQKQVKITGLQLNRQQGILKACSLEFDENNRLTVIKGGVGEGKTTLQKSLQLGTNGSKTLTDKQLYGEIDQEVQLLDGEIKIYVGCKSDKSGAIIYTLYTKDTEGKIVREPV
jgi:predicted ATPase